MRLRSVELSRYRVKLLPGTAPVTERHGALLFWHGDDDRSAVSEMAPLPGFSVESLDDCITACRSLFAAGADAAGHLLQRAQAGADEALATLPPAARFALEAGWMELSQPPHAVPLVDSCRLMGAEQSQLDGPIGSCVKVKVGRASLTADTDRLAGILERLPDSTRLRLDANRSWTLEQAASLCAALPAHRIEYIEEPLLAGSSYTDWTSRILIPFAWDESLRERPELDVRTPGLGAVVLKPMLSGLNRTRAWIEAAERAGVAAVLSAAFESNISLDFYARLIADWKPSSVPGLDTFGAWPEALIRPLQSQPGHEAKPVRPREHLIAEPALL